MRELKPQPQVIQYMCRGYSMKKTVMVLLLVFLMVGTSYAIPSTKAILISGEDAEEVGTASNPIKASFSGSQVISGDLTVGGDDGEERITGQDNCEYIDFNDGGDGNIFFGGDGGSDNATLGMDLSGSGPVLYAPFDDYMEIREDLTIDGTLSIGTVLSASGVNYYLLYDTSTGSITRSALTYP